MFHFLFWSQAQHIGNYHYFFFATDPNIQRIIDTTISVRICNFQISHTKDPTTFPACDPLAQSHRLRFSLADLKSFVQFSERNCSKPIMYTVVFLLGLFTLFVSYMTLSCTTFPVVIWFLFSDVLLTHINAI